MAKSKITKSKKITKTTNKKSKPVKKTSGKSIKLKKPCSGRVNKKHQYTKSELAYFKGIILEKKKEILEELETIRDTMVDSTTGEYVRESSSYSTHMEQGTDAMEREKMFLFASREGKFLNHLEDALKRIECGEYGICTECEKLIEKERLEAVPITHQCLQCKVKLGK